MSSDLNPRLERGRKLCQRLAEDVGAAVPEGIGRWGPAWEIVAAPSAEFLIALSAWEATGEETHVARVREAYDAVLAAWRSAAVRYREEVGR